MENAPLSASELEAAIDRLISYLRSHGPNLKRDEVFDMLGTSKSDRSRSGPGEKRFLTRIEAFLLTSNRGATDLWESVPHDVWQEFRELLLKPLQSRLAEIGRARSATGRLAALNLDCPPPEAALQASQFALVGIGALNLDHIVLRDNWSGEASEPEALFSRCFDDRGERECSEHQFQLALQRAGEKPLKKELGGSAFNVVDTMRSADSTLALGYLGACGRDEEGAAFVQWFEEKRVAPLTYSLPHRRTARCLSYMVPIDGRLERRLLTTRGANSAIVDFIERDMDVLANALARSRALHITSIFDERAPTVLVALLAAVRACNPNIIISVDPGEVWARDSAADAGLWDLFEQADILFANADEFRMLCGQIGSDDILAARTTLHKWALPNAKLVVKHHDATVVYVRAGEDVERYQFKHDTLEDTHIGDATGSGDSFAAGYLLGLLSGGFRMGDCARLGAKFAARRLALDQVKLQPLATIYEAVQKASFKG